jgi:hypothetical protein
MTYTLYRAVEARVGDPRPATARRRRLRVGVGVRRARRRGGRVGARPDARGTSPSGLGSCPSRDSRADRRPGRAVSLAYFWSMLDLHVINFHVLPALPYTLRAPGEQIEETPSIPCSIQTPPRYRTRAEREPPRAGLHRAYTPSLHAQLVEREPCLPPTVVEQL